MGTLRTHVLLGVPVSQGCVFAYTCGKGTGSRTRSAKLRSHENTPDISAKPRHGQDGQCLRTGGACTLTRPSRRVSKCPPALVRFTARVASTDTSAWTPAGHRYRQAYHDQKVSVCFFMYHVRCVCAGLIGTHSKPIEQCYTHSKYCDCSLFQDSVVPIT